ncbi:ANTAR domain-containing protein [Streptomyces canus]|uniref:ANTAR domain-containing protein n=1 Tax=Streptomyces canus TaxID=58343 RepID=UPI003CF952BD
MTTSREQRPQADGTRDATVARLEHENAHLRHAVDSHATVDQAIGGLVATHRLWPAAGFEVVREVSRHTNIKLHAVAKNLIAWGSRCRSRWARSWTRRCGGAHIEEKPGTSPSRAVRRSGPARRWGGKG